MGTLTQQPPSEAYGQMLAQHRPRVIRSRAEYDRFADELELLDFKKNATAAEKEFAELLGVLLADFDARDSELPKGSPHGVLRMLMGNVGMSQADLARLLGVASSSASNIYHGKLGISKKSALKLAKHFQLNVAAFLR